MNSVTKFLTLILLQGAIIATEHNNTKKKALDKPKVTSSLIIGPCYRSKENYCSNECIKCIHHLERKYELEPEIFVEQKQISQHLLNRLNKIKTITTIYRHRLKLKRSYQYSIERLFIYHNYIKPRYVYNFLKNNNITDIETIKILKTKWFGDWQYCLPNSR